MYCRRTVLVSMVHQKKKRKNGKKVAVEHGRVAFRAVAGSCIVRHVHAYNAAGMCDWLAPREKRRGWGNEIRKDAGRHAEMRVDMRRCGKAGTVTRDQTAGHGDGVCVHKW